MPKPVNDSFLCWKELTRREQELRQALKTSADEKLHAKRLLAYGKLLELRRGGFPMLLLQPKWTTDETADTSAKALASDTATITLPGEASGIRLLPTRDPDTNERLLFVQYARRDIDTPAHVELYHWCWQESGVALQRLPIQDGVEALPTSPGQCRLDNRPLEIRMISDDLRAVSFELYYPDGKLLVMGNIKQGIVAQSWTQSTAENPWEFAERHSGSKQSPVLWVHRQTSGKGWQDDRLSLPEAPEKLISLSPATIGRCAGVDAPTQSDGKGKRLAYLASSLGCVLRVDLGNGQVTRSPALGSRVLDVLVVESPEPHQPGNRHCILATTYEGTVFWLEDDNGELKIRYWQHLDHLHIHRLIGTDNTHILAIDQYHRVIPLRLLNPTSSAELPNDATEQLLRLPPSELKADIKAINITEQGSLQRAIALFSLGLEDYLRQFRRAQPFTDPIGFSGLCLELALSDYEGSDNGHDRAVAQLHHVTLQRLFQWMRNSQRWGNRSEETAAVVDLQPIWYLLEIPTSAPDWLWIYLFRNADVVADWGKRLEYDQTSNFKQASANLKQRIRTQRRSLLVGAHQARGLTVRAAHWLPGQPRHLRDLPGESSDQQRLLAFVYGQGLFLITPSLGKGGIGSLKTDIIKFDRAPTSMHHHDSIHEPWEGLPSALVTRIEVPSKFARPAGQVLFVGTDRGECHLVELVGKNARHIAKPITVAFEIATARFLKLGNRYGILLGGSTPKFEAALGWLEINDSGIHTMQLLWTDPGQRGVIRMLCPPSPNSSTPPGICEHYSLWGIERHSGRLLCWDLGPLERRTPRTRLQAQTWYASGGPINAAVYIHSHKQVVCGGHNGLAVALCTDRDKRGQLEWIAGCGSPIRYLGYSPATAPGPGLRLIAGDDDDCVICDTDGRITGFLENVGPISALCRTGETSMALASSSGRIFLLDSSAPDASQLIKPQASTDIVQWMQQPLRGQPPQATLAIEQLPTGQSQIFKETLPSTRVFQWLQQQLKHLAGPKQAQLLDWTADELLPALPPDLASLLIRNPRAPGDDGRDAYSEATGWLLPLLDSAWSGVANPQTEGLLCKLINGILFIAEPRYLDGDQSFGPLIKTISDCLYTPATSDCPIPLHSGGRERLIMLRESQGTRVWQRITDTDCDAQPLPRRWLTILAKLWQIADPKTVAKRVDRLLTTHLPLSGFVQVHPEMSWLAYLVDMTKPLPSNIIPKVFTPLVENGQFSIQGGTSPVIQIWPQVTNWRNWVEGLDRELTSWSKCLHSPKHSALREFMALEALEDRIGDTADEIFRCDRDLPLMGLLWQRLRPDWQKRVLAAREYLDQRIATADHRYLNIQHLRIQWHDAQNAELSLQIYNDRPRAVTLFEWCADEAQKPWPGGEARIAGGAHSATLYFPLRTDTPDQLQVTITLTGEDDQQIPVQRQFEIEDTRSLSHFRSGNAWSERYRRLENMLLQGHSMWWLTGPRWPQQDHQRLRTLVGDKRGDSPATITELDDPQLLLDNRDPVFWPDLDLSQDAQGIALQLHEVLHRRADYKFNKLACALWLALQPNPALEQALNDLLPNSELAKTLLARLIAPHKPLDLTLPTETFVAWCCGDPLEPLLTDESVAPPGPGRLGREVWSTLQQQSLPASQLAAMVGSDENTVQQCLDVVATFPDHFPDTPDDSTNVAITLLAKKLLNSLGDGQIDHIQGIPCLLLEEDLWFLQGQIQRIYVTLPGQHDANRDDKLPPGLWLGLNTIPPATNAPGAASLRIDPDQLLTLLAEPAVDERRRFLSSIGSLHLTLNSELAFQTAGGLSGAKIGRHFHGRGEIMTKMQSCAAHGGCGLVLVAGRRMGKTTLLQRMDWMFKQRTNKPLYVSFDWSELPENLTGAALERAFYAAIWKTMYPLGERFKRLDSIWKDTGTASQQQETRVYFSSRLKDIKGRPGKGHEIPLLLLFDETQHLVDREPKNSHFIEFLRGLRTKGLISIIATAFPHGAADKEALISLLSLNREDNPYYNFLQTELPLEPWPKELTWTFLTKTLGGFGVLLPGSRRRAALNLCQGVPWIAHALGEALTDELNKTPKGTRRWVDSDIWNTARHTVLKKIHTELVITVESAAQESDREYNTGQVGNPGTQLGDERLWQALRTLASRRELSDSHDTDRQQEFELGDLCDLLGPNTSPDAIAYALNKMTQSLVVTGNQQHQDRFSFTANILPMWTQYGNGDD